MFRQASGLLGEAERERCRPMADKSDKGPVRSRLFDIIDSNRDGQMTAEELQDALHVPAHAQSIARLVIHYESEWYYRKQKWDALDEVLGHTSSAPILNWAAEKERIRQLSWWDEVAGRVGLPRDGQVYHLHPVGLVGSFIAASDENDLKWLKVPYGQLTFDVEGNDIDDESNPLHRYFSRVAHWPGGASGVTIGRGYDLGQRPDPENDLRTAGVQEPLLSWLIDAKGLKGVAAITYLSSAPDFIRRARITRKEQYELFLPVYNHIKSEVIRISNSQFNRDRYGVLLWEATNHKLRDLVVDLAYRGDYVPKTRQYIQGPFSNDDVRGFSKAIRNRGLWLSVPQDRFIRRISYMDESQ